MVSQFPKAVSLGPIETIVNVGWPGGFFVLVTVRATYTFGTFGTRTASISMLPAGLDAGGEVVDQKVIQVPAAGLALGHMIFFGVIHFPRMPPPVPEGSLYRVDLAGAQQISNSFNPDPVTMFCGTTTVTRQDTYSLVFVGGINTNNQYQEFDDIDYSYSSPKETIHTSTHVPVSAVDKAANALDGIINPVIDTRTITSAWYIDGVGNYVDTHQPCSSIVGDGSGSTATFTEGFESITADVFQKLRTSQISPSVEWTATSAEGDIVVGSGIPRFECIVPKFSVGLSADSVPMFDDLPNGEYDFRFMKLLFDTLPPASAGVAFNAPGTFPTSPTFVRYHLSVSSPLPAEDIHLTDPIDLDFHSGVIPPASTPFST